LEVIFRSEFECIELPLKIDTSILSLQGEHLRGQQTMENELDIIARKGKIHHLKVFKRNHDKGWLVVNDADYKVETDALQQRSWLIRSNYKTGGKVNDSITFISTLEPCNLLL
jgi:hypothetical protein